MNRHELSRGALTKIQAIAIIVIIVVAAAVGVVAFNWLTRPRVEETIKIGAILQLAVPRGQTSAEAARFWVNKINAEGGLLGRKVELIVEDSKGDAKVCVTAHKKLVTEDRCILVITEGTGWTLPVMESAAELYPEYPHLIMASYQGSLETTDKLKANYNKYKFFFTFDDGTLEDGRNFPKMAKEIFMDKAGYKKIALLIEDAAWSRPFMTGWPEYGLKPMKEMLKDYGFDVVYYATTDVNEKMFLPMFEAIAASGAECILWVTVYTDTLTAVKQWARSSAKNLDLWITGGAVSMAAFWNQSGGDCQGVLTWIPDAEVEITDLTLPFIRALRAKGLGLTEAAFQVYMPLLAFEAAVKKAGTLDVEKLIKTLEEIETPGPLGIIKFQSLNDYSPHRVVSGYPYYTQFTCQWQNGKLVPVWPEPIRTKTNPDIDFVPVKKLRG